MTGLDFKVALVEISNYAVSLGLNGFVQSTISILIGLLGASLLKARGSALVSTMLRATLVAVMTCPLASMFLDSMGFSGFSVELPDATLYALKKNGPAPPPQVAEILRERIETEGLQGVDPKSAAKIKDFEWEESPQVSASSDKEFPEAWSGGGLVAQASWLATLYTELLALWISVAVLLLGRLALCHLKLAKIGRRQFCTDERLLSLRDSICRRLRVRQPRIVVSEKAQSPCLFGTLRPTILLTSSAQVPTQVLVHELAHLVRHDPLWKFLANLLASVLWFQPLVWVLKRKMERASEEVCDDYVLSFEEDRKGYARYLVELSESLGPSPSEATAGAGVVAFKSMLGQRVARILDTSRAISTRTGTWELLLILLLGSLGTFSVAFLGVGGTEGAEAQEKSRVEVELGPTKPKEWTADLGGVRVSLIGMREIRDDGKEVWWCPNGRPMESPSHQPICQNQATTVEGNRIFEVLVSVQGTNDYDLDVEVNNASAMVGCEIVGSESKIFHPFQISVPKDQASKEILIRIAAEDWETLETYNMESGGTVQARGFKQGGVIFHQPYEERGGWLRVNAACTLDGFDHRVAAVTRYGKIITPEIEDSVKIEGVVSGRYSFRLKRKNVSEFRFQTRPYTTILFTDVSLQPERQSKPEIRILDLGTCKRRYYVEGDLQGAIGCFNDKRIDFPNEPTLCYELGLLYRNAGNYALAREQFKLALRFDPGNPTYAKAILDDAEEDPEPVSDPRLDYILQAVEVKGQTIREFVEFLAALAEIQFNVSDTVDKSIRVALDVTEPKTVRTVLEELEAEYPIMFDMSDPSEVLVKPKFEAAPTKLDHIVDTLMITDQRLEETLTLLGELGKTKFEFGAGVDPNMRIALLVPDPMTIQKILKALEDKYPIKFDMSDPERILVEATSGPSNPPIKHVEPPKGSTIRYYRNDDEEEIYEYLAPPNKDVPILVFTEPKTPTAEPAYRIWADEIVWSDTTQSATATGHLKIEEPGGSRIEAASGTYDHRRRMLTCLSRMTVHRAKGDGKWEIQVGPRGGLVDFGTEGFRVEFFGKPTVKRKETNSQETPPGKKWVVDPSGLRFLVDEKTVVLPPMREVTEEEFLNAPAVPQTGLPQNELLGENWTGQ